MHHCDATKQTHHIIEALKNAVSWTIFNNRFHNAIEDTFVNALCRSSLTKMVGAISTAFAPVLSHIAKIARNFTCPIEKPTNTYFASQAWS